MAVVAFGWRGTALVRGAETAGDASGRALLSLAATLIVAGILTVAINNVRRIRQRREEDADFAELQIVKLWDARASVKRSAVLIASHQSAKTYGEQLRQLIELRTELFNIRGVVRRRVLNNRLSFAHADLFQDEAVNAIVFLSKLIDEYRESYLAISSLQSRDEHLNKKTVEVSEGPLSEPMEFRKQFRCVAWDCLTTPDQDEAGTNRFETTQHMIAYGKLAARDLARITEATGKHLTRYKNDPSLYSTASDNSRQKRSKAFDEIRSGEADPNRKKHVDQAERFDTGILVPLARAASLLENIFSEDEH